MKRLVLSFDETGKKLILSDEHIRQLTKWFGPDRRKWSGHRLALSREAVTDATGKKVGETIGIERLPDEQV
jgi:hypothetical protein